ncbi:hemolysin XhlA family protein [bacterium]|jgi:predicted  nucleic acid-binding Zn-ribbon protein|nr:hemolysin XhlA family protein [bacterium]
MNKKIKVVSGEAENLQLHVELCAERYNRMEEKFTGLENRLDYLQNDFTELKEKADSNFNDLKDLIHQTANKRFNTMVTTTGTVIVALIGMLGYIIINN